MQYFVCFLFSGSAAREWVRWETKQSFDGQLYQEYLYQNLLKLDHVSSSYDEKNFVVFFYVSQCSIFGSTDILFNMIEIIQYIQL